MTVRVTTLERTLVDALDRPEVAGGWEEIWRSLGSVEYFDGKRIVNYLKLLGNATTVAKTGYFLEEHKTTLPFGAAVLDELAAMRPGQVRRMEAQVRPGDRFMPRWNLVVPALVADRPLGGTGMNISMEALRTESAASGFRPDILERWPTCRTSFPCCLPMRICRSAWRSKAVRLSICFMPT